MAITVQLRAGEPLLQVDGEELAVGRASHCEIRFADDPRVHALHATLRKLGDRWLAESHADTLIQAGTSPPSRMAWLRPGDMLRLSLSGPELLFEPAKSDEDFAGKAAAGERAWREFLAAETPEAIARPVLERLAAAAQVRTSSAGDVKRSGVAVADAVNSRSELTTSATDWRRPLRHPLTWVSLAAIVLAGIAVAQMGQGSNPGEEITSGGGSDNPALAPPLPPPVPPPPPKIDEARVRANQGVAVWIAVESPDKDIIPLGSGWAAGPSRVITTAKLVRMLEGFRADEFGVLVYGAQRDARAFISVSDLSIHPDYDRDKPTSSRSLHFNVGALLLEEPLTEYGQAATQQDIEAVRLGWPLMLAGFEIPKLSLERIPLFNRLNSPPLTRIQGKLIRMPTLPGGSAVLPRLELDWDVPAGTEGCPVFNAKGKVVGIVSRESGPVSVLLWDEMMRNAMKDSENSG